MMQIILDYTRLYLDYIKKKLAYKSLVQEINIPNSQMNLSVNISNPTFLFLQLYAWDRPNSKQ